MTHSIESGHKKLARRARWQLGALVLVGVCATVAACSSDDSNPSPTPIIGAGSGGESSGGTSAATGGKGGNATNGGNSGSGTSSTGGRTGSSGGAGGGTVNEGGAAGEVGAAGAGATGPVCAAATCTPSTGTNGCFNCPQTDAQYLNQCNSGGRTIFSAHFDNTGL